MMSEDTREYTVLVNAEEQYSLWFAERTPPNGPVPPPPGPGILPIVSVANYICASRIGHPHGSRRQRRQFSPGDTGSAGADEKLWLARLE